MEAESLNCQVIGSLGFGTERGAAQLPWAGGEVISIQKLSFAFFILGHVHFALNGLFSPPTPFLKLIQHTTVTHMIHFVLLWSYLLLYLLSFY